MACARSRTALVAFVAVWAFACGSDDAPSGRDAGPGAPPRLRVTNLAAYEGMRRFVAVVHGDGVDLRDAIIRAAASSPLEVTATRCGTAACGVEVHVRDETPSLGIPIPQPFDARAAVLEIAAGGRDYEASLTVFRLDAIENNSATPVTIRGTVVASSASMTTTSRFLGASGATPIRWLVTGDLSLAGSIDVSAADGMPGAGGHRGGAPGAPGEGPSGGRAGSTTAGGGGGGHRTEGGDGRASSGSVLPATGGDVSSSPFGECAAGLNLASCEGGGGGGAAGAGGPSGGVLFLAALGDVVVNASGATLSANGGDGIDGGGGGSGGTIVVAADRVAGGALSVSAAGGAGADLGAGGGGRGGDGIARIDTVDDVHAGPAALSRGVSARVAGELLRAPGGIRIEGTAPPDATVTVESLDGALEATTIADGAGRWSATLDAPIGLHRFRYSAAVGGASMRGWVGNAFEWTRIDGLPMPVPVGATLDVAVVARDE